jgi:hypothetical protein
LYYVTIEKGKIIVELLRRLKKGGASIYLRVPENYNTY